MLGNINAKRDERAEEARIDMKHGTKEGVVLIALSIVSTTLGWVLANKLPSPIVKDWWDIGSTVGTLGAVLVALYFGVGNERRTRRDAEIAAIIVAARLVDQVTALLQGLNHFEGQCKHNPKLCADNPTFLTSLVFQWTESKLLALPPQDLLVLNALRDGDAAISLARGLAFLDQIASQRGAILTTHSDFTVLKGNGKFIQAWGQMAGEAIHFLRRAGGDLAIAVRDERLFGTGDTVSRMVHERVLARQADKS